MVAIGLLLQSSCIVFSQKETFFEVFPDAVTVHATRALFWPDIPTVFFLGGQASCSDPTKRGSSAVTAAWQVSDSATRGLLVW